MNIDKKKLKLGIWYEDKDGNMYRNDDSVEKPNDDIVSYHVCFPTEINERIENLKTADKLTNSGFDWGEYDEFANSVDENEEFNIEI